MNNEKQEKKELTVLNVMSTITNDNPPQERADVAITAKSLVIQQPKRSVNANSAFYLSREEIERIFTACTSLRDRTLIGVLYFSMMRRDEARNLKIENIDFDNRWLNLIKTKGSRPRTIPLSDRLFSDLKLLCGNRKLGFIFLSPAGLRLSNKAVNEIIAKAAVKAGIKNPNPKRKNINPHIFRHSAGRHFLKAGGRIEVLQKLLGHKSITTTIDIYGAPSLPDIAEEFKRVFG